MTTTHEHDEHDERLDALRRAAWNVPPGLSARARLVLLALTEYADGATGEAFPSTRTLAAMVYGSTNGAHRDRTAHDLADLAAAGHVSDTGRRAGRGVTVWRVHPGGAR